MEKNIGLVICYFSQRWPAYFPHFLASCAANPEVDFLIFTNLTPPSCASNIYFVNLPSLAAFNALASHQLGLQIALTDPYKLCDLKPAYGIIFADYLRPYRFWGYCDIDLIFGNIRHFITDEVLQEYDVISAVMEYPAGFFSLFRNVPVITALYASSRDYQRVFQSPRHFCFDECNFKFGELLGAGQAIEEVVTEIESFAHVVSAHARQGTLRLYAKTMGEEFIYQQESIRWKAGELQNTATGMLHLLVHLINVKNIPAFFVENWHAGQTYYVSRQGIMRHLQPGWSARRHRLLTSAACQLRRAGWLCWSVFRQWRMAHRLACTPVFDGATYLIGNLKSTFYHQERNRYCIISEFAGRLNLQQCQVLDAGTGRYVIREQTKVSLLQGAGPGVPFKIEVLNLQNHACEVGYLLDIAPPQ